MDKTMTILLSPDMKRFDVADFEKIPAICAKLDSDVLLDSLHRLSDREAPTLAAILGVLGELDNRKTLVEQGYPSLFQFCITKLGYTEDQACVRIRAARAAYKYPSVLRMIASRSLSIVAVSRLWPHLTSENHQNLLAKACRRGLHELDRLIASIAPKPEPRPVIRALSVGSNDPPADPAQPRLELTSEPAKEPPPLLDPGEPELKGRVLFRFAASEAFRAKFERARQVMRHVSPDGSPEVIFDRALEALLDRRDPMRQIARKERRAASRRAKIAGTTAAENRPDGG